jgi:hypothetical protein
MATIQCSGKFYAQWIDNVVSKIGRSMRACFIHVDLGPTGLWGNPISYERKHEIPNYLSAIWSTPLQPDTVLIDGRFRVACFLKSLISAKPKTRIIFDDYMNRPHYHIVEEIIRPRETCGRQSLFVVDGYFDRTRAENLLERFIYVRD